MRSDGASCMVTVFMQKLTVAPASPGSPASATPVLLMSIGTKALYVTVAPNATMPAKKGAIAPVTGDLGTCLHTMIQHCSKIHSATGRMEVEQKIEQPETVVVTRRLMGFFGGVQNGKTAGHMKTVRGIV